MSILADINSRPVAELEGLGVARVSYGAAFARASLTAVKDFAEVLLKNEDPRPVLEHAIHTPGLGKLLRYPLHE